jgi:hypothetical protein
MYVFKSIQISFDGRCLVPSVYVSIFSAVKRNLSRVITTLGRSLNFCVKCTMRYKKITPAYCDTTTDVKTVIVLN